MAYGLKVVDFEGTEITDDSWQAKDARPGGVGDKVYRARFDADELDTTVRAATKALDTDGLKELAFHFENDGGGGNPLTSMEIRSGNVLDSNGDITTNYTDEYNTGYVISDAVAPGTLADGAKCSVTFIEEPPSKYVQIFAAAADANKTDLFTTVKGVYR